MGIIKFEDKTPFKLSNAGYDQNGISNRNQMNPCLLCLLKIIKPDWIDLIHPLLLLLHLDDK